MSSCREFSRLLSTCLAFESASSHRELLNLVNSGPCHLLEPWTDLTFIRSCDNMIACSHQLQAPKEWQRYITPCTLNESSTYNSGSLTCNRYKLGRLKGENSGRIYVNPGLKTNMRWVTWSLLICRSLRLFFLVWKGQLSMSKM